MVARLVPDQPPDQGDTSWSFACPTTDFERPHSVSVNGSAWDRDTALTTVIERGRQLILEMVRGDGSSCEPGGVFVSIEQDMVWVQGFFDPDVADPELRERIESAITEQRADDQRRRDEPPAPLVLSATQPGSTAEQWDRVAAWMGENLPAVPIVGADPDAIGRAEAATGDEWPAELIDFYRSVNGLPLDGSAPILPMHGFFDLGRMLEERQMMLDVASGSDDGWRREEAEGSQAGVTAWMILPEFIPIAGLDNYYLFVDTRPGELYGCVTEFADEGADGAGPRWLSISAMLADLADSLETGEVFAWGMKPVIVDGMLEWRSEP